MPREKRTPAQDAAVFSYWRTTVAGVEGRQRADRGALEASIPRARRSWCLRARERPRDTHVLKRGDFLKPAEPVEPGVPAFLNPLPAGAPPTG